MSASTTTTNSLSTGLVILVAMSSTALTLAAVDKIQKNNRERAEREKRFQKVLQEIEIGAETEEDKVLPSILAHFKDFKVQYGCTVEEANKRRTTKYYELARDAHVYDLVPAIRSYPRLRNKREAELERVFQYRDTGKSHRTVLCMLDDVTASIMSEARKDILAPLNYSHDIATSDVWIPEANVLPNEHLHVTIATPWWWHSIRDGNQRLSEELVARLRQALVLEFHHAFQIELERFVLLGGKTLVALWRCVGEREAPDDFIIFDRHGEGPDPIVKLRRDIVECFTSETNRWGQQPLTYSHRHYDNPNNILITPTKETINNSMNDQVQDKSAGSTGANGAGGNDTGRPKLKRQNTIEWKTPGLGNHDGFIHTTLARLPIDCLSMQDVELEPIHRLCREASATYSGHRMVLSKFRFLETTGEGGESNPCVAPIFDECIEAPPRVAGIGTGGRIETTFDLHAAKVVDRSATIGNVPPKHTIRPSMDGLFDDPALFNDMANANDGGEQPNQTVQFTDAAHPFKK